jgi:hypothetical protein
MKLSNFELKLQKELEELKNKKDKKQKVEFFKVKNKEFNEVFYDHNNSFKVFDDYDINELDETY